MRSSSACVSGRPTCCQYPVASLERVKTVPGPTANKRAAAPAEAHLLRGLPGRASNVSGPPPT